MSENIQTRPEFTIEDLVKEPVADYGNYEGENRVFIIFDAISPEMMKLKEGDEFIYQREIYQIKMRLPSDKSRNKNVRFYCLK